MILYHTASDKRNINKVLNKLADVSNFKIKDDVSIMRPIIRLTNDNAINANYCYINKFGRYYFIENIIVLSDSVVELHCVVDVLQTYKKQILNLNTFVERQENNYSPYVTDNEIVTQCKREIRTAIIGSIGKASGSYIALTVSGGSASGEESE